MAQQNLPQATLALSEYSLIETFWSTTPSAKLSSLEFVKSSASKRGCQRQTIEPRRW
jgi:hypothetical protein